MSRGMTFQSHLDKLGIFLQPTKFFHQPTYNYITLKHSANRDNDSICRQNQKKLYLCLLFIFEHNVASPSLFWHFQLNKRLFFCLAGWPPEKGGKI